MQDRDWLGHLVTIDLHRTTANADRGIAAHLARQPHVATPNQDAHLPATANTRMSEPGVEARSLRILHTPRIVSQREVA